ncbi:type VI secretion system baseplate subunit TssG [Massilia sp. NEAU-DD11]|uniref:Type VI secretion system baseplate subunit TssG n=1 Tax=Massilia cellulosiltytica TaxID=2683234 RepID=A0A7X3K9A7_9BURK|nr:type VI secretion system baseplate subunit TssG [Telluria cellulosilytica]
MIARLLAQPQRFEFVQAVRLLLLALGERGIPERRALARHLRFANSLALAFPPSQIEAAALDADGYRLTPSFMGLLGAHGALPLHVTERLLALPQDGQDAQAARAFLDMFSTRMLALWYRAWQKYRVEHLVAAPRDAFLPLLLALAGVPGGGVFAHDGVPDTALAAFAGLLRRRPVSGAVLGRVLSSHFGVAVRVQEGIGHWDPLAPGEQAVVGTNALLGRRALLGERSWRPDLRVRVRLGPLDRARYEHFLPGAPGARALRTLLRLFAVPTLAYDVVLVLRQADLGPAQLDASGRRLGLDSYLLSAPAAADRADLCYELRPLDPLPAIQSA